MIAALKIEPCEYANEIHLVRVSTDLTPGALLGRAKSLSTHYFYDGSEDRNFAIFAPRRALVSTFWFDIQGSDLVIHGCWHHEGDDLLDGTLPDPTEPCLDDLLAVRSLIRSILQ